jgi:hypothetical protein
MNDLETKADYEASIRAQHRDCNTKLRRLYAEPTPAKPRCKSCAILLPRLRCRGLECFRTLLLEQ